MDYIETKDDAIVHIAEKFSNTALCGRALVGSIRPVSKPRAVCPECQVAGERLLTALGYTS